MIDLNVKSINQGEFYEVTASDVEYSIATGFLNKSNATEQAVKMLDAAHELIRRDHDELAKKLLEVLDDLSNLPTA